MIKGCVEWQKNGLQQPQAVCLANEEYFNDEDMYGTWLKECCEVSPKYVGETVADLFKSWKKFAEDGGHKAGTDKKLSSTLAGKKFKKTRKPHSGKTMFEGLKLLTPVYDGDGQVAPLDHSDDVPF
jgi:putative DNA primase/helicase